MVCMPAACCTLHNNTNANAEYAVCCVFLLAAKEVFAVCWSAPPTRLLSISAYLFSLHVLMPILSSVRLCSSTVFRHSSSARQRMRNPTKFLAHNYKRKRAPSNHRPSPPTCYQIGAATPQSHEFLPYRRIHSHRCDIKPAAVQQPSPHSLRRRRPEFLRIAPESVQIRSKSQHDRSSFSMTRTE
jgi:hypothetical protein